MRTSRACVGIAGAVFFCGCAAASEPTPNDENGALGAASEAMILCPPQNISVVNAFPVVMSNGSLVSGVPEVGEMQELEVDWQYTSVPSGQLTVRVHVPGADVDTVVGTAAQPYGPAGTLQKLFVPLNIPGDSGRPIPLDGTIPFSVSVLDSSGTKLGCVGKSGSYTPTPPAAVIEAYRPQKRVIGISADFAILSAPAGSHAQLYMGYPLNTAYQQVTSWLGTHWSVTTGSTVNSGAFSAVTTGYYPWFFYKDITPWLTGLTHVHMDQKEAVTLSRVRVNKDILEQVTWAQLSSAVAAAPELAQYLAVDNVNDPTDPTITTFVTNVLGADYKTKMTPYAAARKLFVAVADALTYQAGTDAQPTPSTAVAALAAGWGDCGDYGMLLTTVLRAIGVPARIEYGFWPTNHGTHVITGFWMPGAKWIPADATSSSTLFPKSHYPYFFGNVPALDVWASAGYGNHYEANGLKFDWMLGPGMHTTGSVLYNTTNVALTNDSAP